MNDIGESNAQQSERLRWMTVCEERGLPVGDWRRVRDEKKAGVTTCSKCGTDRAALDRQMLEVIRGRDRILADADQERDALRERVAELEQTEKHAVRLLAVADQERDALREEERETADSRDRWMSLACKELPDAYDRYEAGELWRDVAAALRARLDEAEGCLTTLLTNTANRSEDEQGTAILVAEEDIDMARAFLAPSPKGGPA